MHIARLFKVLVVGGALMAGCGGVQKTPDKPAHKTTKAATPAAGEEAQAPEATDESADKKKPADKTAPAATCVWY